MPCTGSTCDSSCCIASTKPTDMDTACKQPPAATDQKILLSTFCRPNSTNTKLTTSLCSMSLHQQHKLQQEKKVDELGSKSLFLAAEVSSPIYSTFHACSRRKHHYLQHQPGHLFTSFLQKYTSALACLFHGSQCSPCGVQLQQQAILLTRLRKWRN